MAEVPTHVDAYVNHRDRAVGTVRRELGVLQAAINFAHKRGKLTHTVAVELPAAPPPKERWLTRDEAAKLPFEHPARIVRRGCSPMPLFHSDSAFIPAGARRRSFLYAGREIDLMGKPHRL